MTKEFFEEVMRIPTSSGHEEMMIEYIKEWGSKNGCSVKQDGKKNVYLIKGAPPTGHYYPAFINHMDTVHHNQDEMVVQKIYKEIVWEGDKVIAYNPLRKNNTENQPKPIDPKKDPDKQVQTEFLLKEKNEEKEVLEPEVLDPLDPEDLIDTDNVEIEIVKDKPKPLALGYDKSASSKFNFKNFYKRDPGRTGLGMDDQGGCAIALAVLQSLPYGKALFVVEEEIGMLGSKAADMSFFDDCAFVFSNDSPEKNRATHYSSGVQLYSDEFFKEFLNPVCSRHGISKFNSEPYTDIIQVRNHKLPNGQHLETFNFGNGGYDPHSYTEYAIFSDVCAAEETLKDLCSSIPLNKQYTSEIKAKTYGYSSYGGYGNWSSYLGNAKSYSSGNSDFEDKSGFEKGFFTFIFKKPDLAATAVLSLNRLKKTVGENRLSFTRQNDKITVEGDLLALRYAYLHCFNAENETKYVAWNDFLNNVKGAKDQFESAVTFENDDELDILNLDDEDDESKMSHGEDDPCSIEIFLDINKADKFAKMMNDYLMGEVIVESNENGSFKIYGPLSSIKKAWAISCSVEAGKNKPIEFKNLNQDDQEYFWADVDFDDDDIIYPSPEIDDDAPPPPVSDMDEFWDWFNNQDEK